MALRPFRISESYLDWAHGPGAEDGQPLASRISAWPLLGRSPTRYALIDDVELVYEIADVAELYIDEPDYRLTAGRVFKRATTWLNQAGSPFRKSGATR